MARFRNRTLSLSTSFLNEQWALLVELDAKWNPVWFWLSFVLRDCLEKCGVIDCRGDSYRMRSLIRLTGPRFRKYWLGSSKLPRWRSGDLLHPISRPNWFDMCNVHSIGCSGNERTQT